MKIALLAAFHVHDNGWSTSIAIQNTMEDMGHQVDRFNLYRLDQNGAGMEYTDEGLLRFLDQQYNYDLLLHCDYGMFHSHLFSQVNIKTIMEAGDDPQAYGRNCYKAQYFDYIVSPDKRCVENYKADGLKCLWWPHFADPQIHTPMDNNIIMDKLVVTSCEEGRQGGIIRHLRDRLNMVDKNIWLNDRFFYGVEHSKFMCRGSIVFQASQFREVTRRIFEAAACKRMVLTDHLDPSTGIYDIFPDGKAAVYYNGWGDAVDKILYYREHPAEVDQIAAEGYRIVMENHTVVHRVKDILDLISYE